ncbi:hypothetical protein N7463_002957 [Penicillium fimorum]|uniref:Uncharacterized protein n=1 Tax=Penicillium fimorum TaxID=1882269 RepID=A0A9W9Y1G6_9EURO|nr:hypothetical protein N7463_002957 [Penicillium fimorum]
MSTQNTGLLPVRNRFENVLRGPNGSVIDEACRVDGQRSTHAFYVVIDEACVDIGLAVSMGSAACMLSAW